MLGIRKEKYDLVCSLRGNCTAAHNLQYKNLKPFALPFDWTYFTLDEAVYKLVDGFRNNFRNYALKENLKELPKNPSHPDKIQYEDTYGKIIWANHFTYNKDRELDYQQVKEVLDRRYKRLTNFVQNSKKILFIFSVSFYIKPDSFIYLASTLNEIYSDKYIKIQILSFNSKKNYIYEKILQQKSIVIHYYKREINYQDFSKTNKEWDFLDNIKITNMILYNIKRRILKFLVKLLPYKSFRKKIRRKYHV